MTASQQPSEVLPGSQVGELMQGLVKASRAFQMYLPNNPIYQRATQNIRAAFAPIWAATDELVLQIAETDIIWEEQVVYQQLNKAESFAWGLFKDGMRTLVLRRGAEVEELPRFLETVKRSRFLLADAGDDLLTLLWEQEFELIQYRFAEFFDAPGGLPGVTGFAAGEQQITQPQDHRAQVQQDAQQASPRPAGVVDLDDFDSTLYFLDESEISRVAREVEHEYSRDVRAASLDALFDLIELEEEPAIRIEILDVLANLFPNFLNARDFRTATMVLRETKLLAQRAPNLRPEHREQLDGFIAKLSEPAIVSQLMQSLDEASGVAGDANVAEMLRELRASALEPLITWLPNLSSEPLRAIVQPVIDRLATAHPAEVIRLLSRRDFPAIAEVAALSGRLELAQAVPGLTEAMKHEDPATRLAVVQTLAKLGTPAALASIDRAIDDPDRHVRLAAVRAAGARGYKGALKRVEGIVLGKGVREMDLTEKMAFFEAYGSIAGASGLKALAPILLPRGLLKIKEPPELRACAAMAIGRIKTPEARELLQRTADDKDLVVRNAVNRALREADA